jgi:GT2 family glycosyltransferase
VERAINGEWSMVNGESGVEVLVVDNNSTDGSIDYLQPKFPFVQFIANKENVGFSKANNQLLKQAAGKYVLFLNPDTILPEDGLKTCLQFMESHPQSGALGVRMIDGSGRFLKESKRGFPTPGVSFCKLSGLTKIFPASKLFARYYLGHLKEKETHEVDVLSGAFMFVRKDVLDKTGGFDERFFMYAEDIDLSYRIQQAGYKNYYLPECTIIHFKGESTIKDGRYIKLFYQAMIQFVRKHFRGGMSGLYIGLLKMVIWFGKNKKSRAIPLHDDSSFNVLVEGDSESIIEAKKILAAAGFPVSNVNTMGIIYCEEAALGYLNLAGIIYCEGASFSFRQVIEQVQKLPRGIDGLVHGHGTGGIVGSGQIMAED